jgi:hypothetical protein
MRASSILICSTEYCQQLQKNIKTGQTIQEPRYVDSADFWKEQYSKIHLENKALQDKVLRLEEERRLIRESIDQCDDQDGEPSLVQELLAQSNSKRGGNPRKRHAPDDVEWWLEDQQNQEARVPSYIDDSSLRLNSYGIYSFPYPIIQKSALKSALLRLTVSLPLSFRPVSMYNHAKR